MAYFNEENTVEQMFINAAGKCGWIYVEPQFVPRLPDEVLVVQWLMEALLALNPITPEQAEQVIYKLRACITSGSSSDELITANDKFRKLLFEENSYPFGENGDNINIRFFAKTDDAYKNRCIVTNQWEYPRKSKDGGKRLDFVYVINGIPMIIGEAKTPVKASVTWADGAADIMHYQKSIPEMFVPNIFTFASEGRELQYASIGCPVDKWGPWFADEERKHGTLEDTEHNYVSLMTPERLLDIYRFYSVFTGTSGGKKIKIVCRYQQYLGGEAIVQRVLSTYTNGSGPRKGLIWHFQGSGKSWLMVFAAQKLRRQEVLKAPTVVIVDDRIDLEDQITGDFTRAEIPNIDSISSKQELEEKIHQRKILITTIFKFGDLNDGEVIDDRDNIILLMDEAHRTQEGDLGKKMRTALPNAFFFGLTGTPINRNDHNTFACFGAEEDKYGYISKYTFQNSVEDKATLELNFKTVPVEMHLDNANLQKEFDELTDQISEEDKNELVRRTSVEAFFTAEKRINDVCKYIVTHFREYVEPTGMKAQVVVYNRECCVKYKKALDALLGTDDQTTIVMHTSGDKADDYKAYKRSRDEEKKLLDQFRDPLSPLKFVIVTSKLLTGFDAPILQCMYLDKPMKNHTLLQAICRTNRTYNENKKCGLIVDFVGVFEDVAKSLAFDEETVKTIVKNIDEIKGLIPTFMQQCIEFFPGVDRTIGGWEGLTAAQQCLKDDQVKTSFGRHFARLNKAWEIVSPDSFLTAFQNDYTWLAQVYQSVRPVSGGNLIWTLLGAKTIEIIHRNIETIDIGTPLEDLVVDSDVIDAVLEDEKAREKKIVEIEKMLRLRLGEHKGDPNFKKFAEKLDELRERMAQNLISSIDFLKQLLVLAKDLLEEEKKKDEPQDKRAKARAALTDLFQSIKTEETPIIVEQVVNDIDNEVVNIVRQFNDAFQSVTARREIKKKLRSILWVKYQIKDNDVFERAYQYIEMYY
ncbi:type I restriction endonuclease subunit R [Phocaeicola coprocola]|uniref:type I restriction endonuclease subunit R n=1 Tax=Phocaeicola coprocola TaxID=310298 RepID=UPI001C381478|nr:HsdR family type I site-specific deoxyribonuclease [Phocaeicola coprocola]MBV3867898.1 HsdR family type I site-specific deoxyribonuclease [Phocaeicola coprocola]MBV4009011.1 HsdR family type I site-specific deoxyribonuclease [Phocaeicola coprocola]MBV4033500.1 HsdR family type I site-specific deoxyribonuclease [Phocaeicola coprocola]MBV4040066.1 HsdR family type I site-specific deoxyribonuclease [Phocaeicola coprocola]MBV4061725.1 HsdR family type I site-specific deoxyribonuclease [Phocaeic